MEVAFPPPHISLLPCNRGLLTASPPSTLPFFGHRKLYFWPCSYKRAILRNSNHCKQIASLFGASCIPRKHVAVPWDHYLRVEKNVSSFRHILHQQNREPGYVIARSELAGTGLSESAYPLSEIKLGSKVRGVFFYAITAIAAICLFVVMVVQHPFVLLLDRYRRRAQHFIAKLWATIATSPFVKIEFEGLENLPPSDTPAVYVSNHQSFFDIYTLLTLGRSFKFISKTAIFVYPVIGWAMLMLGTIPLKRMDTKSQLDCLKQCIDLVNEGASVFFFPEGTRSKDGKLGSFKKGAFTIAAKTRVPVVPITLKGTGEIMPSGMESTLNSGSVKVVILKSIEGSNAEVLCNEARDAIAEELKR